MWLFCGLFAVLFAVLLFTCGGSNPAGQIAPYGAGDPAAEQQLDQLGGQLGEHAGADS